MPQSRLGWAWLAFALSLAVHVADEALHDFLSFYNPTVLAIRARFPFLPLPTFTFRQWILGLCAGITTLLCLTPYAFRGARWIRVTAVPLAVVVGILNGAQHIMASIYMKAAMPGVMSAPVIFAAGLWLFCEARRQSTA